MIEWTKTPWVALGGAALAAAAAIVAARRLNRRLNRRQVLRSEWIEVGGLRVHARVGAGAGSRRRMPVVLVHGWGVSSRYMIPVATLLAAEHPVYAVDLPGHGRSDTPPRALTVPELADALVAWMAAAGIGRAALLANSLGCQVATEAAVRHPDRVDRMVLVGPTIDGGARTVRQQLPRLLATGLWERPSILLVLALDYGRMGPRRLYREMRHMFDDRIEARLPHVAVPAMVVRGSHDLVAPQRWTEEVAALLRAPPPVVVPGWGHALNYSAPAELARAIGSFLDGAPGRRESEEHPAPGSSALV
jgi:pimeloyl-ACP methyl ester carboxylesterase